MDVLKFINSKSIAKHLETIGYKFNALEAAFIVWQSKLTTMNEKFEAWEQIITEMPDMSIKKRPGGWDTDEPSLHAFLRRFIDCINSIISDFCKASDEVYTYSTLYNDFYGWVDNDEIYTSFELCKKAVEKEMDDDLKLYSIKKHKLNTDKTVELVFNTGGDVIDVHAYQDVGDDSPWLLDYFEGLWFKFPTPFKKGDIVYHLSREIALGAKKKDPFVLTDMCTWGEKELRENGCTDEEKIARCERLINKHLIYGDTSDMHAFGHWTNECGRMYSDHTLQSYLDLDYYNGELEPNKKFLTALSNYEKGEMDIELLLNAYLYLTNILRNDHIEKHTFCAYLDEHLKLAGLK